MKKNFSPDAAETPGSASSAPTDTHVRHIGNVPDKDAVLLNVSQTVNTQWAASSFMSLVWKAQPAFAEDVAGFEHELESRNTAGGKRSQQSQAMENIEVETEDAVPYVKSYITEKFGPPNATAHFAEFGLEHRHHGYELPRDRQRRKDALRMMMDAIHANGFDDKAYGTAFWTDIKTRYDAALSTSLAGAGDVSADVGNLVTLRTTLRRVLHSVLLILEANYPDTFDQVRREWGFQKENY